MSKLPRSSCCGTRIVVIDHELEMYECVQCKKFCSIVGSIPKEKKKLDKCSRCKKDGIIYWKKVCRRCWDKLDNLDNDLKLLGYKKK